MNIAYIPATLNHQRWPKTMTVLSCLARSIPYDFIIKNIPHGADNRYLISIYFKHKIISHEKNINSKILTLVGINEIDIGPHTKFSSKTDYNIAANIIINHKDNISIDFNHPTDTLTSPVLSTYYTTINYYESMHGKIYPTI